MPAADLGRLAPGVLCMLHRGLQTGPCGTLTIERFSAPSSAREARSLRSAGQRVLAALKERTVWCGAGCSRALHAAAIPARELDTGVLSGIRPADIVVLAD